MLIPETPFLLQRFIDAPVKLGRNLRIQSRYWKRFSVEDGIEDDGGAWTREGLRARRHFVQKQAEGKEIRAAVDFFSARLLRGHVCDGAEGRSR